MRQLIILLLLPINLFAQEHSTSQQLKSLMENTLYVTQLQEDVKKMKKLGDSEKLNYVNEINQLNDNLRTCFESFWDISDTIIYYREISYKTLSKENKKAFFMRLESINKNIDPNVRPNKLIFYSLYRSNQKYSLGSVVPIIPTDTSLLSIVTEVRKLKLIATEGDIWNKKNLNNKVILIDQAEPSNFMHVNYRNMVMKKYAANFELVNYSVILNSVLNKDPNFIYVFKGGTYSSADGTLISLF